MSLIKLHEIKIISQLALPLIAAFLAQKGMQLIDTMMMGWLGVYPLAAGALGTTIFMTIMLFCMGTLSAVGVFIIRARGANQIDQIKFNLQQGFYLVLFLALICMLLVWNIPYFLPLFNEDSHLTTNIKLLLHGLTWGIPGYLLFLLMREFIAAFTLTRVIMLVTVCSLPLTFILNYILMYGKYGFPVLGIAGIGYSGAITMWFMFLCLYFYSKRNPNLQAHLFTWQQFKPNVQQIMSIFKIGAASGTTSVLDVGSVLCSAIMMSYFGVYALAAHQITMQCVGTAYSIPFSIAMATALQVAHAEGANDFSQVKRFTLVGIGMGLFSSSIVALLFITHAHLIVQLFFHHSTSDYVQLIPMATTFLTIAAFFQCLDAIQAITNGALRGLKDTFVPMLIIFSCYWLVGIGTAYYFAFHTHLGAPGIWYGLNLGFSGAGVLLAIRFIWYIKHMQIKNF
jgi:MATE family multidrug resistance protein